ncbi:MAG: hypothetical protein J0L58_05865 [Burkholderiales bacterium]|nr:hypothetical protein [Burkholderiales bacterium]
MSLFAHLGRGLAGGCLLALCFGAQAGVITNASGHVTAVTDLAVLGKRYEVSFVRTNTQALTAQAQVLWADDSHYRSAVAALVSELNLATDVNSFIVSTIDGARNNDFGVASPAGTYAYLRATSRANWAVVSWDQWQPISASFTLIPGSNQVPEPTGLALAAVALFAVGAARRRPS